jgi:hypothetical protein
MVGSIFIKSKAGGEDELWSITEICLKLDWIGALSQKLLFRGSETFGAVRYKYKGNNFIK